MVDVTVVVTWGTWTWVGAFGAGCLIGVGCREGIRGGTSVCGFDAGVGSRFAQLVDGTGVVGSPPGMVCGVGGADCCRRDEVAASSTSFVRSRSSETRASSAEALSSSLSEGFSFPEALLLSSLFSSSSDELDSCGAGDGGLVEVLDGGALKFTARLLL